MKEGWEYKTLGSITTLMADGPFGSNLKKEHYTNERQVRIIQLSNIGEDGWREDNKKYTTFKHLKTIKRSQVVAGDIVIAKMMPAGRAIICPNNEPAYVLSSDAVKAVLKKEGISNTFILYQINSPYFRRQVYENVSGSGRVRTSLTKLRDCLLQVPPLSEQLSVVDYLNTAFAKIDALKANAEKQLNDARALFQAELSESMMPKEGWEEKTIGDICEIIRGKRFVRADIVQDGVPCIHYGDIYTHYGLSVTKTRGCIKPELAKKMRFAEKNDVVVVQAGENNWDIGVGVAYFGEEPAAVHDACFILKHKQNPMYISYYLRSYNYHWYLVDYVHEGKICSFLKPALEKAPIPLPPLSEQQQIVTHLDALSAKVKELEKINEQTQKECDALKQAMLREIFE